MNIKNLIILSSLLIFLFTGCTKDFDEVNSNPNSPTEVPTSTLMINAQKRLIEDTRDEWFSGRMALLWSQYWAQVNYTEEDRYQYRENSNNTAWKVIYADIADLQQIIDLNMDEETSGAASASGANVNQIASARVLKCWAFHLLTDTYGPVPYHSVEGTSDEFEALKADEGILNPTYASQDAIYYDLLSELKAAYEQFDDSKDGWLEGDNIYDGDVMKWKKFANSLRLRVALRMRGVDQATADQHINEVINSGVYFTSNADNAAFAHEANSDNASPMYNAYVVSARTDFALTNTFVDLLKGQRGPFTDLFDPRLKQFGAPTGITPWIDAFNPADYGPDDYVGQPYGVQNDIAAAIGLEEVSLPYKPVEMTYAEVFMDAAEVQFILSEVNGWDQTYYETGVALSMEKWGVPQSEIDAYMAELPAASEENVLTQKYIALYMQPYQAWAEYRRTGFPAHLVKPGETVQDSLVTGGEYTFESLKSEVSGDLPARVGFSQEEQLLNPDGFKEGKSKLGGENNMATKLWWDVN